MASKKTKKKNIWIIPSAIAVGFVIILLGLSFLYVYLVGGFKTRYEALKSFSFATNVGEGDNAYIRLGDNTGTGKYYIFYKEIVEGKEAQEYSVVACYDSKVKGILAGGEEEESLYYKDVIDKLFGIEYSDRFKAEKTVNGEKVAYFNIELFQQQVLIYRVHNISILPEPFDATELDFDLSIEDNTSGTVFATYREKLDKNGKVLTDLKGYPVYEDIPYNITSSKQVYVKKPVEILVRQNYLDENSGLSNYEYNLNRIYELLTQKVEESKSINQWTQIATDDAANTNKFNFNVFDEIVNDSSNVNYFKLSNYLFIKNNFNKSISEAQKAGRIYNAAVEIFNLMFVETNTDGELLSIGATTENLSVLEKNIRLVNANGQFLLKAATSDSENSLSGAKERQTGEVNCKVDSKILSATLTTDLENRDIYIGSTFNVSLSAFVPNSSNKPYGEAQKKVRYFSSSEEAATVNEEGKVIVKKEENFTIYAYVPSLFEYEEALSLEITTLGDLLYNVSNKVVWAASTFEVKPVKATNMDVAFKDSNLKKVKVGIDNTFTFTLEDDSDNVSLRIWPDSSANTGADPEYMYSGMLQKLEQVAKTLEVKILDNNTKLITSCDKTYLTIKYDLVNKGLYNGVNVSLHAVDEFNLPNKTLIILCTLTEGEKTFTAQIPVEITSVVEYELSNAINDITYNITYQKAKDELLWKAYFSGEVVAPPAGVQAKDLLQDLIDLNAKISEEELVAFAPESNYKYLKFFVDAEQDVFLTTGKIYNIKGSYFKEIAGLQLVNTNVSEQIVVIKEGILYPIKACAKDEEISIYPMLVKTEIIDGKETPVYVNAREERLFYYNGGYYTTYPDAQENLDSFKFVYDIYSGEVYKYDSETNALYQDDSGEKIVLISGQYYKMYDGEVYKDESGNYFTAGDNIKLYARKEGETTYLYVKQEVYSSAAQINGAYNLTAGEYFVENNEPRALKAGETANLTVAADGYYTISFNGINYTATSVDEYKVGGNKLYKFTENSADVYVKEITVQNIDDLDLDLNHYSKRDGSTKAKYAWIYQDNHGDYKYYYEMYSKYDPVYDNGLTRYSLEYSEIYYLNGDAIYYYYNNKVNTEHSTYPSNDILINLESKPSGYYKIELDNIANPTKATATIVKDIINTDIVVKTEDTNTTPATITYGKVFALTVGVKYKRDELTNDIYLDEGGVEFEAESGSGNYYYDGLKYVEFVPAEANIYYLRTFKEDNTGNFVKINAYDADKENNYYTETGDRLTYTTAENLKDINYFAEVVKENGQIYNTMAINLSSTIYQQYTGDTYVNGSNYYDNTGDKVYFNSTSQKYEKYSGLYNVIAPAPAPAPTPEPAPEPTPAAAPETEYVQDTTNTYNPDVEYFTDNAGTKAHSLIKVDVNGFYCVMYKNGGIELDRLSNSTNLPEEEFGLYYLKVLTANTYYAVVVDVDAEKITNVYDTYFVVAGEYLQNTEINNNYIKFESSKNLQIENHGEVYYFSDAVSLDKVYVNEKEIQEIYLKDDNTYSLVEDEFYNENLDGNYYGVRYDSVFKAENSGFYWDPAGQPVDYPTEKVYLDSDYQKEVVRNGTEPDYTYEVNGQSHVLSNKNTYYIKFMLPDGNGVSLQVHYLEAGKYYYYSSLEEVSLNDCYVKEETGTEPDITTTYHKMSYLEEGSYIYNGHDFVKVAEGTTNSLKVEATKVGYYYYFENNDGDFSNNYQEVTEKRDRFAKAKYKLYMVKEDGYYYFNNTTKKIEKSDVEEIQGVASADHVSSMTLTKFSKGDFVYPFDSSVEEENKKNRVKLEDSTTLINLIKYDMAVNIITYHDNTGAYLYLHNNETVDDLQDDKFIRITHSSLLRKEVTGVEPSVITNYYAGGIAYNINANTSNITEAFDINFDGNMNTRKLYYYNGLFYTNPSCEEQYLYHGKVLMNAFKIDAATTTYYNLNDFNALSDKTGVVCEFYKAEGKEVVYAHNNWCYATKDYYVKEYLEYNEGSNYDETARFIYISSNKVAMNEIKKSYRINQKIENINEGNKISGVSETINTSVNTTVYFKLYDEKDFNTVVNGKTLLELHDSNLIKIEVQDTNGGQINSNYYEVNFDGDNIYITLRQEITYVLKISLSKDLVSTTNLETILNATIVANTTAITAITASATVANIGIYSAGGTVEYYQKDKSGKFLLNGAIYLLAGTKIGKEGSEEITIDTDGYYKVTETGGVFSIIPVYELSSTKFYKMESGVLVECSESQKSFDKVSNDGFYEITKTGENYTLTAVELTQNKMTIQVCATGGSLEGQMVQVESNLASFEIYSDASLTNKTKNFIVSDGKIDVYYKLTEITKTNQTVELTISYSVNNNPKTVPVDFTIDAFDTELYKEYTSQASNTPATTNTQNGEFVYSYNVLNENMDINLIAKHGDKDIDLSHVILTINKIEVFNKTNNQSLRDNISLFKQITYDNIDNKWVDINDVEVQTSSTKIYDLVAGKYQQIEESKLSTSKTYYVSIFEIELLYDATLTTKQIGFKLVKNHFTEDVLFFDSEYMVINIGVCTDFGYAYDGEIETQITNDTLVHYYLNDETYYGVQELLEYNATNTGTGAKFIFKEEFGLLTEVEDFGTDGTYYYSTTEIYKVVYNGSTSTWTWYDIYTGTEVVIGSGGATPDRLFIYNSSEKYEELGSQTIKYLFGNKLTLNPAETSKDIGYGTTAPLYPITVGGSVVGYVEAITTKDDGTQIGTTLSLSTDKTYLLVKDSSKLICKIKLDVQEFDPITLSQNLDNKYEYEIKGSTTEILTEETIMSLDNYTTFNRHDTLTSKDFTVNYDYTFNSNYMTTGENSKYVVADNGKTLYYTYVDENGNYVNILVARIITYTDKQYIVSYNLKNTPLPQDYLTVMVQADVIELLETGTTTDFDLKENKINLSFAIVKNRNASNFIGNTTSSCDLVLDNSSSTLYRKIKYDGSGFVNVDGDPITIDSSVKVYYYDKGSYKEAESALVDVDYFIVYESYKLNAYVKVVKTGDVYTNSFEEDVSELVKTQTKYTHSAGAFAPSTPDTKGTYYVLFTVKKVNVLDNKIFDNNGNDITDKFLYKNIALYALINVGTQEKPKFKYELKTGNFAADSSLVNGEYYYLETTQNLAQNYVVANNEIIMTLTASLN